MYKCPYCKSTEYFSITRNTAECRECFKEFPKNENKTEY